MSISIENRNSMELFNDFFVEWDFPDGIFQMGMNSGILSEIGMIKKWTYFSDG